MTVRDVVCCIKDIKFVIINADNGDLLHSVSRQYFYTLERPVMDLRVKEVEITAYKGMCAIVTLGNAESKRERKRIQPKGDTTWKDVG